MNENIINGDMIEKSLVSEWPEDETNDVYRLLGLNKKKLVILDDDPTGTQTVHDLPILTEWSVEILEKEFRNDEYNSFYILTNSRSMTEEKAVKLNKEIGLNLLQASKIANCDFSIISRGDSTLRGHFPAEIDALQEVLEEEFDGWLIIPFFVEGGRFTINDVNYVKDGDKFIPVGLTPFAKDHTFGFKASNLKEWVEEKTKGRIKKEEVHSISLEDIRKEGPLKVKEKLMQLKKGQVSVINCFSYNDMAVFVKGLLLAEEQGKKFLYRTASSFVKIRTGNSNKGLLMNEELNVNKKGGGLVIVGSYVPKTTKQVEMLLKETKIKSVEVDVSLLINDKTRDEEIKKISKKVDIYLSKDKDVVIYTSRKLNTGSNAESSLTLGNYVSLGLVKIVHSIKNRPRYIIAKGGITSSDIATKGIKIKRAIVMGQILKGIPVWRVGNEGLYPDLTYVVFPGNVGDEHALADAVKILSWNR